MKSYCRSNLLRALVLNFERLDILRDSIGLPSEKLLSLEFAASFRHSIFSVSIYYGTQSDIRAKSYCPLNWIRGSTFNFERLDVLRDTSRHLSENLLSLEFAQRFSFQF